MQYLYDEMMLNAMSFMVSAQLLANHFAEQEKGILIGIDSVGGGAWPFLVGGADIVTGKQIGRAHV